MKIDESKLARQELFIQKWLENKALGVLEAVTAFGKSYCGVLAIQRLRNFPKYNTLVVVPSGYLRDQWLEHVKTFNLKNVSVKTIHSIIRLKELPKCSLLIVDEQHEFFGEQFSTIFKIPKNWYMGLSGSLTEDMKTKLKFHSVPVIDVVTTEEALKNKWISEFGVYNLALPLTYNECELLDQYENDYHENMVIFEDYPEVNRMFTEVGILPNGKPKYLAHQKAEDLGLEFGEVLGKAKVIQKIVRDRQKFFYQHPSKKEAVKEILEYFPNRRAMTFSLRTEYIDFLKSEDSVIYHSKMKVKEQKKSMSEFLTLGDKCRCIHSGKSLVRGADFPDISLGIRVSYDSSPISWVQTRGRHIRKEGDKISTVINLYMKRPDRKWSTEERWLRNSIKNNDLNVKWITSLNEI